MTKTMIFLGYSEKRNDRGLHGDKMEEAKET